MKRTLLLALLSIFLFPSCEKDSEWIVLYGEVNDDLASLEINGDYYYYNIEYFFINKKSQKCYRNLDTNNYSLAKTLLDAKISRLNQNKFDKKEFQPASITQQTSEYVNIEFADNKGRHTLYKINLLDKENDNVFVYIKHKDKYLECLWTDRKSKTRRTKKFTELEF